MALISLATTFSLAPTLHMLFFSGKTAGFSELPALCFPKFKNIYIH
jgi:hypothetical protein